jgi:hypothetical protein
MPAVAPEDTIEQTIEELPDGALRRVEAWLVKPDGARRLLLQEPRRNAGS